MVDDGDEDNDGAGAGMLGDADDDRARVGMDAGDHDWISSFKVRIERTRSSGECPLCSSCIVRPIHRC